MDKFGRKYIKILDAVFLYVKGQWVRDKSYIKINLYSKNFYNEKLLT